MEKFTGRLKHRSRNVGFMTCLLAIFVLCASACTGTTQTTTAAAPPVDATDLASLQAVVDDLVQAQAENDCGCVETTPTTTASATTTTQQPAAPTPTPGSRGLLSASDLRLTGSFTVPDGQASSEASLAYAGNGLAYNAANGSLFLTGHSHHQYTAEIAVPNRFGNGSVDDLPRATYIQEPADATHGNLPLIASPREDTYGTIGGYMLVDGQLVISGYHFYDAANTQTQSHFLADPSFTSPTANTGAPFTLSDDIPARWLGGPMAAIPQTWRAAFGGNTFLTGLGGISIAGNSSVGPAAAAFSADTLNGGNPARLVLGYPLADPLDVPEQQSNTWNLTSEVRGMVFPEGSDSVLFIGSHGVGEYCYGTGEACGDTVQPYQGTHAPPYRYQVWAYDAQDLADVYAGSRTPESLDPHDVWELDLPISTDSYEITGVAYNSDTGQIFIGQGRAERNLPVIHVFELSGQ